MYQQKYLQSPYYSRGGLSGLGDANAPVFFQWSAPTHISGLRDDWNTTAARFKNLLAQRGFQNSYVTWEIIAYFPTVEYKLVMHGNAPQGIDGAENVIADLAEQAGFVVTRDAIFFKPGGTPSGGADDDPTSKDKTKPTDYTPLYIAGALMFAVLMMRR